MLVCIGYCYVSFICHVYFVFIEATEQDLLLWYHALHLRVVEIKADDSLADLSLIHQLMQNERLVLLVRFIS